MYLEEENRMLKVNIDIKNDTFLPVQLSSAEYEAMYYLRSRSAVDAVKVTVSSEKAAKEEFIKNTPNDLETEECLTCSA